MNSASNMTDERIREVVAREFQARRARGLMDGMDSVTWLSKVIMASGIPFPRRVADAKLEFVRLGYETVEFPHGSRGVRTYVKEPVEIENA